MPQRTLPLTPEEQAEFKLIKDRMIDIQGRLCSGHSLPYDEGEEIIAELETCNVRLENILGGADKKEQDHLHKIHLNEMISLDLLGNHWA